jgi:hypothetical protein
MAEEITQDQLQQQELQDQQRQADIQREENKELRRIRLEVVKLAKDTLIENSRYKAVDERDVSSDDILSFSNALFDYVNIK